MFKHDTLVTRGPVAALSKIEVSCWCLSNQRFRHIENVFSGGKEKDYTVGDAGKGARNALRGEKKKKEA